jgi:hypothetical protein
VVTLKENIYFTKLVQERHEISKQQQQQRVLIANLSEEGIMCLLEFTHFII